MELRVVFVLSMIACSHYLVFPADGRQIKSTDDDDSKQSSPTEKSALVPKQGNEPEAVNGYVRPSVAVHRSVSGRKQVLPPSMPDKNSDFGVSVDGYKEGFRPTTPGSSPGVGHSFEQDDEETEQKPTGMVRSINDKHFKVAGDAEGFRPTNPGHSPGIGHASEPNA